MSTRDTVESEASERRIRKHIHGKHQTFEIECAPGFSQLCKRWCERLWEDYPNKSKYPDCTASVRNGRIFIESAPFDFCHDLLFRGQPFTDVKFQIFRGRCSSEEKLKTILSSIHWELYIPTGRNIEWDIRVDSLRSQLYNEKRIKSQCIEFFGKAFSPQALSPTHLIACDFNLEREVLTISISLGGRTFWQRGQKQNLAHAAPLREDLAACLIIRMSELGTTWDLGKQPTHVVNPFCGTGTLLHEAALFLSGLGNQLDQSERWTYRELPFFKKASFLDRVKKNFSHIMQISELRDESIAFYAEDIELNCISATRQWFEQTAIRSFMPLRIEAACVNSIEAQQLNTRHSEAGAYWIVSNPPFGLRLSNQTHGGTESLYRKYSERIASLPLAASNNPQSRVSSWLGVVLCPDENCWRIVQSRLSGWKQKCEHFTLGGLDIRAIYFGYSQSG